MALQIGLLNAVIKAAEAMADTDDSARSADTKEAPAREIRKGGLIVIEGRPCRVMDVKPRAMGKDGSPKSLVFTTMDVFTAKKSEEVVQYHDSVEVPHVQRLAYEALGVDEDGHVSLIDGEGEARSIELPDKVPAYRAVPCAGMLSKKIRDSFEQGRDFKVIVQSAHGFVQIVDIR